MAGITNEQALDLLASTLKDYPDDKKFETLKPLRRFEVVDRLISTKKKVHGGTSVSDFVQLKTNGSFRWAGMYDTDAHAQVDTTAEINVPWAHTTYNWIYDRLEMLQNAKAGASKLFDVISAKRMAGKLDFAKGLEYAFFSRPHALAAGEKNRLFPLFYWASFAGANVETEGGYIGQTIRWDDDTTTTVKAGLDNSLAANRLNRNWAATYTTIDQEFLRRLRLAKMKMHFMTPKNAKDIERGGDAFDQVLYCSDESLNDYLDISTQRGDSFGMDVEPFGGSPAFSRVPIRNVDVMTAGNEGTDSYITAAQPWVFVNFGNFSFHALEGNDGVEHPPHFHPDQHNIMRVNVDNTIQSMCNNVREGVAIVHKKVAA